MQNVFIIASLIALTGVTLTLLAGMIVLSRGDDKSRLQSQRLMRLRVMLQALTVILLLLAWLA